VKLINLVSEGRRQQIEPTTRLLFQLYQQGIDRAILLENGLIRETTFMNACIVAGIVGEYAWGQSFWQAYHQRIMGSGGEEAAAFARASLYFQAGQFAAANQFLQQVNTSDLKNRFRLQFLYVRILFELYLQDDTYLPSLEARIQAVRQLLKLEKRFNTMYLKGYRNFLNGLLEMTRIRERPQGEERLPAFWQWLETTTPLQLQEWLIKKARQAFPGSEPSDASE
jgi:hypothetical protein